MKRGYSCSGCQRGIVCLVAVLLFPVLAEGQLLTFTIDAVRESDGLTGSYPVETNIDWDLLAKFRGTIVFYMAIGSIDIVMTKLIDNGLSVDMPCAVATDVSLPSQRVIKGFVKDIAEKCQQKKVEPPGLVVIGYAVDSNPKLNWYMRQPLFGKNIVVTRNESGNEEFAQRIIQKGGSVIRFATIKLQPLTHTNAFVKGLAQIADYDWVIFTSPNGVEIFFQGLAEMQKDVRVLGSARIAVIGDVTAAKLKGFGIKADFVPSVYTSYDLARELLDFADLRTKKILCLRAENASDELPRLLLKQAGKVDTVSVYKVVPHRDQSDWLKDRIKQNQVDWITFASPSSVSSFFKQIDSDVVSGSRAKIASIGPMTSKELENVKIVPDAEAKKHTIDGLILAMENAAK